MHSLPRGLVSALAAISLAGSTLLGIGISAAHAAGTAPSLLDAPVPASCGHPATRLHGYEKDYPRTNGHTTLDVAQATTMKVGRDHHLVTVAPLSCSANGQAWPDLLLAYGPGTELVGAVRMRTLASAQKLGTISELHREAGRIAGTLTTSTANGYMSTIYDLRVGWHKGHLQASHGAPIYIDGQPADASLPYDGPTMTSRSQSGELKPAPAGLRAFLAAQWTPHTTSMSLPRFANRVNGRVPKNHSFALIEWNPGDEEADVAGRVDGTWRWLHTYWNRGQDLPDCSDLTGVTHRAWVALGLSCLEDDGHHVSLGAWPIDDYA